MGGDSAADGLGIRIEQQLGRIEPMTFCRRVGAQHPIAVILAWPHPRLECPPYTVASPGELDPLSLGPGSIKEAQFYAAGMPGVNREAGPLAVPGGTQPRGQVRGEGGQIDTGQTVR